MDWIISIAYLVLLFIWCLYRLSVLSRRIDRLEEIVMKPEGERYFSQGDSVADE